MNHTLPSVLQWGKGTTAYFAHGDADKLIVFIHGFGGDAIKTWRGMEGLLADPKAGRCDLVFYGYSSLTAPAWNSATLFRRFLDTAAGFQPEWQAAIMKAGADPVHRDYREIIIVGHSLGAVVARRALLDALRDEAAWLAKVRLVLFGPAHMGTRLMKLKQALRSSPMAIIADLFTLGQVKVPVLDDLAEGSRFLATLQSESKEAIANGHAVLKSKEVWFGENDYVVVPEPFCDDPNSEVEPNEDHISICKMPKAVSIVTKYLP